jgi:hypothetical protein
MSSSPKTTPMAEPAVRNYMFLCFCALLVLTLALLQRGLGQWSLVPVLVGLVLLLLRWRMGPALFLISLGALLYVTLPHFGRGGRWRLPPWSPPSDFTVALAALTFLVGHYRLQGVSRALTPQDARRVPPANPGRLARRRFPVPEPPAKRSGQRGSVEEIVVLLIGVLLCSMAALLSFGLFVLPETSVRLIDAQDPLAASDWADQVGAQFEVLLNGVWRFRLLIWGVGAGLLIAGGVLSYLAWLRLTPAEAALFLQDTAWQQTRGEERRLNSWIVWDRLWRKGRS